MYWLDNDSGVTTPPAIPPVVSATRQYFTEGGAGEQPSIPGGEWFNMITDELLAVLTAAGITPTKANHAQLLDSLQAMYPNKSGDTMEGDLYGITAQQFTNDKRFATTEFVQRALGNYSGISPMSTTQTLDASFVGKFIGITIGGITLTLPSRSSLPDGATFSFKATSASSASTVVPPSGDTITVASGRQLSSITIQPGETLTVVKFGSTWVGHGDAVQEYNASLAAQQVSNGYQKLPSGLIIQWGSADNTPGATSSAIFPIAFPNTCLNVTLCGFQVGGNQQAYAVLNSLSAAGFSWNGFYAIGGSAPGLSGVAGQVKACYIAIGN